MSNHNNCFYDCGGTDCPGAVTSTATSPRKTVVYISDRGIEFKTIKEAAIDDIKSQPFFGGKK